jgi:UDP-glucose 4-epimerase
MRVLISGGAGFIGSHLVDSLVAEGNKVTIIDDLSNGTLNNLSKVRERYTFLRRDVSTPFYKEFPKSTNSDVIFHLACFPRSMSFEKPTRDVEVNVNGMVNILELARKTGAKVIFSSNSGIYDTSKIPINEEVEDTPKTPYDLNKLTAERYLKLYHETYGVPYTIFRFATVYGPRQRTSPEWKPVVIEFIDKLSKGQSPTIYWDGEQTRDFINVRDIKEGRPSSWFNGIY